MTKINLNLGDCMEAMASMPDNAYDLAIVDPPYGIGAGKGIGKYSQRKYKGIGKEWDKNTPNKEYFNQLFRVSKNQIICGANYFVEHLYSTKSFICWVKNNPAPTFAQAEYLWTSLNINGKVYDSGKQIIHQIQKEGGSIHPTQKPVKLYEWLLMNYAQKKCNHKHSEAERHLCTDCNNSTVKILDTHGGSMSIALACHNLGFNLDLWELDEDYHKAGVKRFNQHIQQQRLF